MPTPFDYNLLEDEVVSRLVAALPTGYQVITLPEKQKDFVQVVDKCLLVVAYSGSDFDSSDSTDNVKQKETVSLLVNVKSAKLRGSFGIHEALRFLKITLQGFKSQYFSSRFELKSIDFDDRDEKNNWFSYNITFNATKPQVQVTTDEDLPLLQQVTFNDQYE